MRVIKVMQPMRWSARCISMVTEVDKGPLSVFEWTDVAVRGVVVHAGIRG